MLFLQKRKNVIALISLAVSTSAFNTPLQINPSVGKTSQIHDVFNLNNVHTTKHSLSRKQGFFMSTVQNEPPKPKPPLEEKSFDPLSLSTNPLAATNNDGVGIWTARGLLLLVAVLWGTNFASVKYLETLCFHPPCHHPPSEAALARFGVAALISLPLLINQRKDVILAGIECGIWITLGYFTQALALSTVPSGKCAFICSLTVVVVPLLSAALFGKEIKSTHFYSAALALGGVGILEGLVDFKELLGITPVLADADVSAITSAVSDTSNHLLSSSMTTASSVTTAVSSMGTSSLESGGEWLSSIMTSAKSIKGDLLALGQPLGFGFAFMRIEHYVEKFKDVENRILTISAAQCVSVGFLSLLWVLYDFHGVIPNMQYMIEPHRIGAIAWTGIMTTVVAIYFEGIALQKASATEAALIFASEPVWASLFGAWLLHEKLGLNSYIGGFAILSACILGAVADLNGDDGNPEELDDTIIDVTK